MLGFLLSLLLIAPLCAAAGRSSDRSMAVTATNDLLNHFWIGDASTGHVLDTYNGYARTIGPDRRGILWERATFVSILANLYQVSHNPTIKQRISSDWAHMKKGMQPWELQTCGDGTENVGQDDAGWSCLMYLNYYKVLGDPQALSDAEGLFDHAYTRWADDKLGGGLWYNDKRQFKSTYETALVLAAVKIYEITKDRSYLDRAVAVCDWAQSKLMRDDGLFWCEDFPSGPQTVGPIQEARSVTFLGGNMAMGVVDARLWRDTGEKIYLRRALAVAAAIRAHETDGAGHYLDDRDAYADGYFMGDWARDVLTLPGIPPADRELMRRTARAIFDHDRTVAGYYGGSWDGPAEGAGSAWWNANFRPEQIMVSANAVNVIVGAAQLDAIVSATSHTSGVR